MRSFKNRMISAVVAACLLLPTGGFAQNNGTGLVTDEFLKDETYLDPALDSTNDIAYTYAEPQYDENPDPNRKYFYETFFAPIEEEGDEEKHVAWAQNEFEMERRANPNIPIEVYVLGAEGAELKNDPQIQGIIEKVSVKDMRVTYENVPNHDHYSIDDEQKTGAVGFKKDTERAPASLGGNKVFLTLLRGGMNTTGSALALIVGKNISPKLGMILAVNTGLMSGALQYWNAPYGKWLTSSKWTSFVLEEENWFTRMYRKSFGIDPEKINFAFKRKIASLRNVLTPVEELLKWSMTEIAYTSILKTNMLMTGIAKWSSFATIAGDVLSSAGLGILAQAPGDIAIQKRKYQKIEELKKDLMAGKVVVAAEEKVKLLGEIDAILKGGSKVTKQSHELLRAIQSWADKRAAFLSVLQVSGVVMNLAGVPGSVAVLIGTGVGGGLYYAKVKKWTWKGTVAKTKKIIKDATTYIGRVCPRYFGKKV